MQIETRHTLEVYGYTWAGYRSVYSYTAPGPVLDDASAKRLAGDFADIIDWRCVRSRHSYARAGRGLYTRTDEYRTLRGFRNGMRPSRFYRLANAV